MRSDGGVKPSKEDIDACAQAFWHATHENVLMVGGSWAGEAPSNKSLFRAGAREAISVWEKRKGGEQID